MSKHHLNLSNFKKINEDHQSATLRHPAGHEIKIAKSSLSPKVKGQLAALPTEKSSLGRVSKPGELKTGGRGKAHFEGGSTNVQKPAPGTGSDQIRGLGPDKPGSQLYKDHMAVMQGAGTAPTQAQAEGGSIESRAKRNSELKGINAGTVASGGHESYAGSMLRSGYGSELPKLKAQQVHAEMKSMPKPKLMAEGGKCESCPCPKCRPARMKDGGFPPSEDQQQPSAYELAKGVDPNGPQPYTGADPFTKFLTNNLIPGGAIPPQPEVMGPPAPMETTGAGTPTDADSQAAGKSLSINDTVPGVGAKTPPPMDPNSPAEADDSSDSALTPSPAASTGKPDTTSPTTDTHAEDSSNLPEYNRHQQEVNSALTTPEGMRSYIQKQAVAFDQDLADGHITPKTYGDLFHDKDTLGKIGMLFGMLAGGFGSGLSGQPNALLGMMDKVIANDLDAQKTSKTNAMNFVKMNQSHQRQLSDIELQRKTGNLTDAQANQMTLNSNVLSNTLSSVQAKQAAFHDAVLKAGKITDPTQRQNADRALGIMYNSMKDSIKNEGDAAAGLGAWGNQVLGGQDSAGQPQGTEAALQNRWKGLKMSGDPTAMAQAKFEEERHVPGLKGLSSAPVSGEAIKDFSNNMDFQRKLEDFQEWTAAHSGDLNLSDRNIGMTKASNLQGAYRIATHGGVFKLGEQDFIQKIIDSTPTKFFNSIRVLPQVGEVLRNTKLDIDQKAKNAGFQGYAGLPDGGSPQQQPPKSPTASFKPGQTMTNKSTGEKRTWDGKGWK